ncbi:hypothetical protein CN367_11705 [Priestia megaterium]|uniref:hypothetical protein n=1 Tax=Priestia megaterium TaxID=1404 RepID=UPI000BF93F22|nr:hypothetical protein [Priestia megaterium]PEZ47026.1 hypothetical protein CN367_11705 [Priestia megaterium]
MSNAHMYEQIKDTLREQIQAYLLSKNERVDVYPVPYQNIAVFPAVALELTRRRKVKKGLGVRNLELDMVVWVYTDIMDAEDAEKECFRITEIVEDAIESDKTLGGKVHYLTIDDDAQFGTVEQGEANFLQGAKLSVKIEKRFT